jgi:EmrB/QacA subfamily drug resistance transporter
MTILDSTIVVTALPSIGPDLGLTNSGLRWIVIGYVLAYGGLLLFLGRSADLLGRKRMFVAGNALWALSSLMCGVAGAGEILIAGRIVQGVAAAIIAPAALSIVMITFPDGPERNKAFGIWGGLGGVGATAGLLLGGVITDGIGWPWIFFINIPVGLAVLAIAPLMLKESRVADHAQKFDVAGAITVTAALGLLVYVITSIPAYGMTARTLGLLLAAAALSGLFVVIENRSATPLVPFQALRSRLLIGGNLLILTAGMTVDGMLITLTSYVQQVLGWSAMQFGLLAAIMTVTSVAGVMYGQHAVTRHGIRPVAVTGAALLTGGCLLLTMVQAGGTQIGLMVAGLLVFGAGMGAAFVGAQIAALTDVAGDNSGLAAALTDTSFNIGTGLGVAIATSVALAHTGTGGAVSLDRLTEGYRMGFGAAVAFAAVGVIAALVILRHPRRVSPDGADPVALVREPS